MKQTFKKFANVMVVGLLLLISGSAVQAQQQRGQQGPPPALTDDQIEEKVADVSKTLSLTDEQEAQVSEKYFAHFEAVEDLMKSGRPDRDVMETMNEDFQTEIKALLTEDQQKLYENYLKEQEKNRPQRPRR